MPSAMLLVAAILLATSPTTLLADAPNQPPVMKSKVQAGSVTIPDEIAPAVVPYLFCLNNAVNEGIRKTGKGADAAQTRVIEGQALQFCRPNRETAAKNANTLMKKNNRKLKEADRTATIEAVLVNIEAMTTGTSAMMDQANADSAK